MITMLWKRFAYHAADTGTESATVTDPSGEGSEEQNDPGPVPYDRFSEVNEERNTLRADHTELSKRFQEENEARIRAEAKLEALEASGGNGAGNGSGDFRPLNLPEPPEGLEGMAKVEWYIQAGVDKVIANKLPKMLGDLGLDPERLKQAAEHMPGLVESQAEVAWRSACEEVGVDPNKNIVKATFKGLMAERQMEPMDALRAIAKELPNAAPTKPPKKPATQINSGALSNAATESIFPKNTRHATQLAHEGKRTKEYSMDEIFDMADSRRASKR